MCAASIQPEGPKSPSSSDGSQSKETVGVSSCVEDLLQVRGKEAVYEALSGLPFQVRDGKVTCFDHSTDPGTVILGVAQLKTLGITKQSLIDFICFHELGHFFELSQDPIGYRSVIDEGKRADGLGESYFRFYNALLDIYVNRNTMNRAPVYGDGAGGFSDEIKDLYRQQLFKERDLTKLPKSTQYSYALLNIGMGVGADLTVSAEVKQALEEPIRHLGKDFDTETIIERWLVPAIGLRANKEWRATVSERKSVIDKTFRKRFEALVELDKKENRDPNEGASTGDLEGVEPSIDDLDKAVEQADRIQREAKKTPEERAADTREKQVGQSAAEHLSAGEAKDLAETHRRVYPQILQVADIFKEIVREIVNHRRSQEGFFRTGQELSVDQAVSEIFTIQNNPSAARIFMKDVYEEVLTQQPQHIRVWGVFDLSGSMAGDLTLLKEISVIFSGAAQTLSLGAQLDQHSLKASFASVGYHDTAFEILPLTEDPTYVDIAKSYAKLKAEGGTYEAPALEMVAQQLAALPRDENVVDIVVAVTDGETEGEGQSKAAILALKALGAKLLAFQFSRGYLVPDVAPKDDALSEGALPADFRAPPQPESGTFGRIWGADGHRVRRASQVIPALRVGLRDLLKEG